MNVLITTTISNTVIAFLIPHIQLLVDNGHSVDLAFSVIRKAPAKLLTLVKNVYDLPFQRNPFHYKNLHAFKSLRTIISQNKYDLIHTHTPTAGALTRLAAIGTSTKVIYTAHGFHFYKGAPLLNWLIYFPVEWLLSFFTDTLITINTEDFEFAKSNLHAKKVEYVPGVGIDLSRFENNNTFEKDIRNELGISRDAIVLLSIGELNKNKNHETALKAFAEINNPNTYYIICGQGPLKDYLAGLATKLNISDKTFFLGYRSDILEIMKVSDIFIHPSFREGLPVSLMEAMASGLPCIASKIRGNADLIKGLGENYLFPPAEMEVLSNKISELVSDEKAQIVIGNENLTNIENFALDSVLKKNIQIYSSFKVS